MRVSRPLQPFVDAQTYRTLLFLGSAIPLGTVGGVLLIAGWVAVGSVLVTPLVVPALIAFRAGIGLLAQAESALARELLGADSGARRTRSPGRGFWGSGWAVVADGAFWQDQVYAGLRAVVGGALAVGEFAIAASGLYLTFLPIYYRWVSTDVATWRIDTVGKAFAVVPAGLVLLVVAANLVPLIERVWQRLASSLLGGVDAPPASPAEARAVRRRALVVHATSTGALNLLLVVVWAVTKRGYFWPEWPLITLGLPLAVHAWIELLQERPALWRRRRRVTLPLAIHAGAAATLGLFFVLVWGVTSRSYFWPIWPILALAAVLTGHTVAVVVRGPRLGALAERIEALESSRAGAVDVQEADLRRIERDLHDGAQARLVALGMSLGMAEQKLAADPAAARELVAEARVGVEEALRELRDLARGIHPPVLTDRGLGPAIGALADRSAIPVSVSVDVPVRPAAPVETAAYFVAAEALANAAKHAGATRVAIRIVRDRDVLVLQVEDDGTGGADPAGAGLTGLRRRVEALDGTLTVTSPPGGPTVVRAELPCAS